MSEDYVYDGASLTTVRDVSMTQRAELGAPGGGTWVVDDTDGTLAIVGQMDVSATDSSCSVPLTFRGFVEERQFGRNAGRDRAPHVGAARGIAITLTDLNAMLGFRLIDASDGKRPAETVAARGAWLMASDYVSGLFDDNGRCSFSSSKGMDKADYRNQYPGDVLGDMALAQTGVNYYVADWGSGPELTFRDDNASTADTSTLRISNVIADKNATTLYPFKDATLTRRPGSVYSKIGYSYAKGTVYESRAATATAFNGERGGTASNSLVKTAAKASAAAEAMLWQHSTEEDTIDCTVLVPDTQVNLILAGHRIQVKFSHLANTGGRDYDTFTWCRVLERTVTPIVANGELYEMDLRLSPQEDAQPAGAIVQRAFGRSASGGNNLTLPSAVTIGNLLVFAIGAREDTTPAAPSTSASQPRFGAGAWTKTPNVTINAGRTGANVSGVAIYYKTADATDATGFIGQGTANYGIWEITGADISAATAISIATQADSTSMDIGTLGGAAGDVAVMIHLWDEQATAPPFASPPHPTLAAVTPDAGWSNRWYDSSYESWPLLENAPVVAICDAEVTGTINPRLSKSFLSNWGDATWCGAALLIPPL